MGLHGAKDIESRFSRYVEGLVSVVGHADRVGPLHDYCLGLVMPGERKSVEPMAAITAPGRTAAQHQSLLHFVGQGGWSDAEVLGKVQEMVLPSIERYGPIEAWIIDDTSFPKQGRHSVGVAHQYCGQLGKQANCQVAVTLSLANHDASLPVAYRLYLPKAWAEDDVRRVKAKVPEDIAFKTKPEIALEQIRWACEIGLPGNMVVVDAGYGHDSKLRVGITELGRTYVAGIQPQTLVRKPGVRPGIPPKKGRRDAPHTTSVKDLARGLSAKAWRTIKWREGTNEWLSSRFARVQVHVASSHERPKKPTKVAADRVARGRGRADQVLALDLAEKHHLPRSGRRRQIALAGRARLSGTQAGGRARTLRGTRLARLSPSRHPVHRGIWIPDLREGDDSPLKTSFRPAVPATCHTRQLSTPRILPCGLNGTSQTRSPPCAEGSSPLSSDACRAAHAAAAQPQHGRV